MRLLILALSFLILISGAVIFHLLVLRRRKGGCGNRLLEPWRRTLWTDDRDGRNTSNPRFSF